MSPVFHRKHHAVDEDLHHCNYGMLLTFWDDLFGTADRRAVLPSGHGLPGNPVPETLWGQFVYPFAEILRPWRARAAPLPEPVAPPPAES